MTENECGDIILSLKSCGINFLAIDFDDTLICVHTGGNWKGEDIDLASKIRPMFKTLVPLVLKSGILIAIVTFSCQVDKISTVLHLEFPELASQITIRGEDKSWEYKGGGSRDGKQGHMASAAEELMENHKQIITRNSTLLLDDDVHNIRAALSNEVRAIRFYPNNIRKTIDNLLALKDLNQADRKEDYPEKDRNRNIVTEG